MAKHTADLSFGRVIGTYRLWPLPVQTPRWFDDSGRQSVADVWSWLRSHGLIRLHEETNFWPRDAKGR